MSDLTIFNNVEFGEIRTLEIDNKPYFFGCDIAKALGYAIPSKAVNTHCKGVSKIEVPTNGEVQQMLFISEGDLYRLILNSKLPTAEKFEHWVFDEVLPSIRKHGLYAKEELLNNPDLFISALQELKAEKERTKLLELENAQKKQIISELKPKASYYDLILQNKSLLPISKIAKDYGMSGKAFNKMLHELGIQFKQGNTWLLYQQYADKGYTQSKTHAIDANHSVMHTYWTQKGRLFLYDLLKNKKNFLPVIERKQSA
ncbi:phage antirepressor [Metabacillus fastidiosus]|uniref:Phage antirepressor KilAC domain-containing protein n=1 Tax=Metabacillus fastidiosus TaxID=1458 RepID=A0ABU6NSU8_9BACI|nr:phage antirepressor KilAC domain-containing protein [Metabacillus fastidiosus]MED4400215.1 phage antirepressor KilAC domain-containing protein [Metabacillus fastidiosus]